MFGRLALKYGMKILSKHMDNPKLIEVVVKAINRKVDIPKMPEKQEADLIRAIIKGIVSVVVKL